MAATRSVAAVAVMGAVALGAAACTVADHGAGSVGPDPPTSRLASSTPTVASPSGGSRSPASPRATSGSQARAGPPRSEPSGAAHVPDRSGRFTLVVTMGSGTIRTNVAPISVSSNEPVDPPHETAEQWNTAAWVEQSTYPSTPDKGTSYVYGHACHYHVCPFTDLKDARVGDRVHVTTAVRTSTYTIDRTGLSPKSAGSLPSWASDSTVRDRIVLVTCAYEQGDTSMSNIVVVARLNR